jgi:hypothetical protein
LSAESLRLWFGGDFGLGLLGFGKALAGDALEDAIKQE